MYAWAARAALIGLLSLRQGGLEPKVRPINQPVAASLEALWQQPNDISSRDLFQGASAGIQPPISDAPMIMISQKTTGFSPGYDVRDAAGHEWSVKMGDEAQTEVVASRLVWAIGYHQPPTFYVEHWVLADGPSPGPQPPARFRSKNDRLKSDGVWSWHQNPFVGTQPYRGLLVTMLLLNSTDLRTENNIVYHVKREEEPTTWYVVRDLGATLGETGIFRPRRNDIDAFEREPFLLHHGDSERLGFRGLQRELLRQIGAADLRWIAALFNQLSESQWRDAFRAGGYDEQTMTRYIAALRDRLAAAATIDDEFDGASSDYWMPRHLPTITKAIKRVPQAFSALVQ